MKNKKFDFQRGQVALIALLVMLVVGTIALSVASRSITDVSITKQEEEKIRAFSAAEAGIEDLLTQGLASLDIGTGQSPSEDFPIDYEYGVEEIGGGGDGFVFPDPLVNGETVQVWIENGVNTASGLNVYFGVSDEETACLEISVFNSDNTVARYAYKGKNSEGEEFDGENGFSSSSAGGECMGTNYNASVLVPTTNGADFVRIKALYNSVSLAVEPASGKLPVQAYKAIVSTSEGESSAAVEVIQSKGVFPEVFDHALWSGDDLKISPPLMPQ